MNRTRSNTGFAEGVLGAGALAVGIIGLAGVAPWALASIGVIVVGLLILVTGGAHSARQAGADSGAGAVSGFSAQTAAGTAGLVLGILGLLGVVPLILTGVAVIAFGATFILAANDQARRGQAALEEGGSTANPEAAREALASVTSGRLLIGAADLVLGIIAVADYTNPMTAGTLVLVAILVTGSGSFLAGAGGERLLAKVGL